MCTVFQADASFGYMLITVGQLLFNTIPFILYCHIGENLLNKVGIYCQLVVLIYGVNFSKINSTISISRDIFSQLHSIRTKAKEDCRIKKKDLAQSSVTVPLHFTFVKHLSPSYIMLYAPRRSSVDSVMSVHGCCFRVLGTGSQI